VDDCSNEISRWGAIAMGAVIQGIATRNELPGRSWNVSTRKSTAHMGIEIMEEFVEGKHNWVNRYVTSPLFLLVTWLLPILLALLHDLSFSNNHVVNGTHVMANGCVTKSCDGLSIAPMICPTLCQNLTLSIVTSKLGLS
jgi:hypothetical protein